MALSARDRTRYARHLLLPQLGEAGQERLLASTLHTLARDDAGARDVAAHYLARAGVCVRDETSEDSLPLHVASRAEVDQVAGSPALREAARALVGALAAVHAIQTLAGLTNDSFVVPSFAISSEET